MIDAPVRDHMQRDPVTVASSMTVEDLAELFAGRGIAYALVVDDGRLVGVVSESDLVLQEVGADDLHLPHAIPALGDPILIGSKRPFELRFRKAFGATVGDIMERDVVTVRDDETVHEAARAIVHHDVSRLPVVGPEDTVVGTIGRSEIVRALAALEFE